MTISTALPQTRSYLTFTVGIMICLILLINVSFKIIALQGLVFTAGSVLCPLVAILYLWVLQAFDPQQQRHILNQSLLALYLFSIGIYLLVNLPAAEYLRDNPAYQIVFDNIPKKFFAATLAFGLSFYLPHLFFYTTKTKALFSQKKCLFLAIIGGLAFFSLDFFLLFADPKVYQFKQMYFDSLLISSAILFLGGVIYLLWPLSFKALGLILSPSKAPYLASPFYHYLVAFAVTILLICLACEYRLISFSNGWTLAASGLLFPLTIMVSNLIAELYGYRANLRFTLVLVLSQLVFDLLLMGTVALPSPEFFNLNPFYSSIMPRRILAGTLALFVTFICNAFLLEKLKNNTLCQHRGWRIVIANVLSSSLLCLISYGLLFGGIYPYEQIFSLLVNAWTYKIMFTLLSLPLVLWLYHYCHQQLQGELLVSRDSSSGCAKNSSNKV